ncbi:hypothetical protein ANN_12912 [Periplaneta americana]|uniref:DUF4817 domain-containing protein n=1 Tax=Periplaneta americana TaxID=6978 RepID=A0ABQ8THW9_PERAM|nr:hypothetical protein ANN_12912 [Periplaneta americana]
MQNAKFTLEQRVFMYDAYVKTESCREVHRQFKVKYSGAPIQGRETVRRLVNKLRTTGSINATIPKRKRRVLMGEKSDEISVSFTHSPNKSLRRVLQESGYNETLVTSSDEERATILSEKEHAHALDRGACGAAEVKECLKIEAADSNSSTTTIVQNALSSSNSETNDNLFDELHDYYDYMEDNYALDRCRSHVRSALIPPPEIWNCYNRVLGNLPRATYTCKACHARINKLVGKDHPFLFCLLEHLQREVTEIQWDMEKLQCEQSPVKKKKKKHDGVDKWVEHVVSHYQEYRFRYPTMFRNLTFNVLELHTGFIIRADRYDWMGCLLSLNIPQFQVTAKHNHRNRIGDPSGRSENLQITFILKPSLHQLVRKEKWKAGISTPNKYVTITEAVQHHFKSLTHLHASNLLNSVNFSDFSENFPDVELEVAVQHYSTLNKNRLKTELRVLSERQNFKNT